MLDWGGWKADQGDHLETISGHLEEKIMLGLGEVIRGRRQLWGVEENSTVKHKFKDDLDVFLEHLGWVVMLLPI